MNAIAKTQSEYVFKNSFVFMETGNLKVDICRAMKDEIGYMCENKHKLYLKEFCEMQTNNMFYGDVADMLNRLKNILLDSSVNSLKEYFEYYKFQVNIGLINESEQEKMKLPLLCLRQFDDIINDLAYDIVAATVEHNFVTKYGVFAVITQYFEKVANKKHVSIIAFLDTVYAIIFETIKIKYGGTNGKKL